MRHVFFWLKEPENNEHKKKFEKSLKELIKVKTIKISHIGVPASTESRDVVDHSYTYLSKHMYMQAYTDNQLIR